MNPYLDIFYYDNAILGDNTCGKECHIPLAPFFEHSALLYTIYGDRCRKNDSVHPMSCITHLTHREDAWSHFKPPREVGSCIWGDFSVFPPNHASARAIWHCTLCPPPL